MKICDVVMNSVWYDPRVRKQIVEYQTQGINVFAVGLRCERYDTEKIKEVPCKTEIVCIDSAYEGHQRGIFRKLKREKLRFQGIRDAIIAGTPDIIHANDLNALIPAYMAKKKLKCRLVYDSHEINTENNWLGGRRILKCILKAVERHIVRRVDQMVCVSHAAADYFAETYGIERPMVITNCTLKKERGLVAGVKKHRGFEVLNHGQFYEGRGYDVMMNSCTLLSDVPEVILAVRGFGKLEKELREAAKKLKNPEQFRFYPPVSVQDLIPEAAHSHVGVAITLPICLNFELSVSNKIFEYAAAGLPVIMSDIPEHRYLNEKYGIGIIMEDNTPESFAEAVRCLHNDAAFYEECAKGAQKMSAEVNWETEFGRLINVEKNWGFSDLC